MPLFSWKTVVLTVNLHLDASSQNTG